MKIFICLILTLSLLAMTGCNSKPSNTLSQCIYCGGGMHVEGDSTTYTPSRFPSENPPAHIHLYAPLAGYTAESNIAWTGDCKACLLLRQMIKLRDQDKLSDDVVNEWFAINAGNPDVVAAFAAKHGLNVNPDP